MVMKTAINLIGSLVITELKILVSCSGGMSRSPLIASAVIAQVESIDFDDAIRRVTGTGPCDMSPNLYAAVKQLL